MPVTKRLIKILRKLAHARQYSRVIQKLHASLLVTGDEETSRTLLAQLDAALGDLHGHLGAAELRLEGLVVGRDRAKDDDPHPFLTGAEFLQAMMLQREIGVVGGEGFSFLGHCFDRSPLDTSVDICKHCGLLWATGVLGLNYGWQESASDTWRDEGVPIPSCRSAGPSDEMGGGTGNSRAMQ